MTVRVEDELTGTEVMPLVTEFRIPITINHNSVDRTAGEVASDIYPDPKGQGKLIEFRFKLLCDENYFGRYCDVFCASRNDELGHFSCDQAGNIVCLDRFTNPSTNCTECLLAEDCCKYPVIKQINLYRSNCITGQIKSVLLQTVHVQFGSKIQISNQQT